MKETTLTVYLPSDLVQGAERYAAQHETSLTELIALYLDRLITRENLLEDAPTVRRVSGILASEVSIDEYHAYLEEKYGHPATT